MLGAILIDNTSAVEAFGNLSSDKFVHPYHSLIYRAMEVCNAKGEPIELNSVCDALRAGKFLEAAGGAGYVASLADGMPRTSNIAYYVKVVNEKAKLREIVHFAESLHESAHGKESATEILERGIRSLIDLSAEHREKSAVRKFGDFAQQAISEIYDAAYHPEKYMRGEFGLKELDETTGGFRECEKVIIVGRSSDGKSLLAWQFAAYSQAKGLPGTMFSAEMRGKDIAARELAFQTKIPLWILRRPEKLVGRLDLFRTLTEATARCQSFTVDVIEDDVTPDRIVAITEANRRLQKIRWQIVDFDQLVVRAGMRKIKTRNLKDNDFWNAQAEFMDQQAALANRLEICTITISQPRKVDEKIVQGKAVPQLGDIFGSTSIGNAADSALWAWRNPNDDKDARVYIMKARNDVKRTVNLGFDTNGPRFLDAGAEEEAEPEPRGRRKRS